MYELKQVFLAALFIGLAGIVTAQARSAEEMNATLDDLYGDHAPYHAFFEKLKKAVAENDKKAVASMVDYPFMARIDDRAVTIRDAAHFVADYDKVFTTKVKRAVSNQTYPSLFANWQGIMIGDGEVWFSGICSDESCKQQAVKIIAVND